MLRAILLSAIILIAVSQAEAGDQGKAGRTNPGTVARQFYESNLSGVPGGKDPARVEAISEKFFTGAAAGDYFGLSIAGAGDVNGDGYGDVIVGAHFNDAGGADAGRAYIYYGGPIMDMGVDVMLTGAAAADWFGHSVSGAGDVNGDGYGDVIVGAYGNDAAGTEAGRAYVFYGGPSMDKVADVTLTGVAAGDWLGYCVAAAGDVNGDGYADVLAGAYHNDAGGADAGAAYVYYGGPAMNSTADVTLIGVAAAEYFGNGVGGAGDVNGDGYGDVIVGAYGSDAGGTDAGRAYIFYGGAAMNATADVILTGEASNDFFGYCSLGGGDVNGDGYSDVIVGANGNDAGGTSAGRAYIFYGSPAMNSTVDVTLTGAGASEWFGNSVAIVGDVNGDGFADAMVGAYGNDAGGGLAGRAYIYFGGSSMDVGADITLTGREAGERFGQTVAGAGDVNGDGYADVMAGAFMNDAGGANAGRAYIYMNSLTGSDISDEFFTGEAAGDYFGYSVACAGDVNDDGSDDVIVGAYANDAAGSMVGRAYVFYGGPGMDATADVTLTGLAANDWFGRSVAGACDVNGDGYADVIVGAPYNDVAGSNAGAAYIFYGGSPMNSTADVTLTGAAASDVFGMSVAGAGDLNGDGYGDVIVGALLNDGAGAEAGRAYAFFGGASMNSTADVTMSGEAAGDRLGTSVAGAGDVNGDGYADVIVGARNNDDAAADAGAAYIFYGASAMDGSADVTLTGVTAADNFGNAVAGVGDVNGDTYADVIVGAEYNDFMGIEAGRAYVFYGGPAMNAGADVTLSGAAAGDLFGGSVAAAGDVNSDGFADVIVGAEGNALGGIDAGAAYIYFGGASMNSTADITVTGAATGDNLGGSVAGAGDVNGDGFSDVIVGATGSDAGGSSTGRAYLYRSSSPPIVPRIASVRDVPIDQGGKVLVRWMRSGYDAKGTARITDYVVQRSLPPGFSGFAWENIATLAATQDPQYAYAASTLYDSTTNASGTFFFRVIARTSSSSELWRSLPLAGHSVDNLAPMGVSSLVAQAATSSSIQLHWPADSYDPDLAGYEIYRAMINGFAPGEATRIQSVQDTSWLDSALPAGVPIVFYRVSARDVHGNVGQASPQAAVGLNATQSYPLAPNWNMVSVPLEVADYARTALYPTATSEAFSYAGVYTAESTLAPGKGYWLKFPSAQSVSMTGFGLIGETVPLLQGWNMIGSLAVELPVAEVVSHPPGLAVSPFYTWSEGAYVASDTLWPQRGYWVKASASGNLLLTVNGAQPSGAVQVVPSSEMPPNPPFVMTDLAAGQEIPTAYGLEQNYPNPFNPRTEVRSQMPEARHVKLAVYDMLGREVALLVNERRAAGFYQDSFDGSGLASGIYIYRMTAGSYVQTKKMTLVR